MAIDWMLSSVSLWLLAHRRVSPLTHMAYMRDISKLCEFIEKKYPGVGPAQLQLAQVSAFLVRYSTSYAAASRARCAAALRAYLRYLAQQQGFPDLASQVHAGGAPRMVDRVVPEDTITLLIDDMRTILATPGKAWRHYQTAISFILLYATGMRVSELVMLRVTDIESDKRALRVTGKRGKQRIIPLAPPLASCIELFYTRRAEYLVYRRTIENTWLLPSVSSSKRRSAPVSRATVWRMVHELLTQKGLVGKRLGPHLLRHTIASHLLSYNWNLRTIQTMLGHEQITTVQRYAHIDIRRLQESYSAAHPRSKDKKTSKA